MALLIMGRLASSSITHWDHLGEPKVIHPKHKRLTCNPVLPNRVVVTLSSSPSLISSLLLFICLFKVVLRSVQYTKSLVAVASCHRVVVENRQDLQEWDPYPSIFYFNEYLVPLFGISKRLLASVSGKLEAIARDNNHGGGVMGTPKTRPRECNNWPQGLLLGL